MADNLILKRCSMKDIDILIDISKQTFVDAFEKENDPEDFKNYLVKAFNEEQMRQEVMNENSLFYFMVQDHDGLVGYIKLNRNEAQKEKFDPKAMELERIYVLKEHQGRQLGQEALLMIINMAKKHQASCLWLGVWERNTRAIAFYERHGFVTFGKHSYLIGEDEQYDWMMKLDLEQH